MKARPSRAPGRRTRAGAGKPKAAREPEASTRERILGAALQVFAEQGFDGARTRDIAERAGANLGLIKYYFDTKEKLWREAVSLAFLELQAELADVVAPDAVAAGGERAALERLLRHFVRFVARRPEFMRLMNDEGKRSGPRMRWLADRYLKPMHAVVGRLVASAEVRGVLPPIAPALLHYIALGAAGLVFSQAPECAYVTGLDPGSEAFVNAHADAVVQLLLQPRTRPRRSVGPARRTRKGL